jgi:hypothetical protein
MIVSAIGFLLCAGAIVVMGALSQRDRDRLAPFGDLLDRVMATRAARVAIIVFWWWIGWHFLVAQTVDPTYGGPAQ